jgi:hypothetical protein
MCLRIEFCIHQWVQTLNYLFKKIGIVAAYWIPIFSVYFTGETCSFNIKGILYHPCPHWSLKIVYHI